MAARSGAAPAVAPAHVPAAPAAIEQLHPPTKAASVSPAYVDNLPDDDGDDAPFGVSDLAAPVAIEEAPVEAPPVTATVTQLRPPSRPQGTSGLRTPLPQYDPTRTLTQRDLVMARLKVSQAMSKVNQDDIVRMGNWYHTISQENLGQTVIVVPIDMRMSRSYFVDGQGVLCRSFDMVQGEGTPGLQCDGTEEERYTAKESERGCPLRLWKRTEGKNIKPPCGISYNYPVLLLDPDDLAEGPTRRAMLSLRGSASKTARMLNTLVTDGDRLGDLHWYEAVFELSLDTETNSRGQRYFVPTIRYLGRAEGSVAERARAFFGQWNPESVRATYEASADDDE